MATAARETESVQAIKSEVSGPRSTRGFNPGENIEHVEHQNDVEVGMNGNERSWYNSMLYLTIASF